MTVVPLLLAAALATGAAQAAPVPAQGEGQVRLEIVGRLATGLVAFGGETTGVVVRAKGVDWELDLGADAALRKRAQDHSGRAVVVKGTLEPRAGVESRRLRMVVRVTSLEAAPE